MPLKGLSKGPVALSEAALQEAAAVGQVPGAPKEEAAALVALREGLLGASDRSSPQKRGEHVLKSMKNRGKIHLKKKPKINEHPGKNGPKQGAEA